jgi:hypothetical protein
MMAMSGEAGFADKLWRAINVIVLRVVSQAFLVATFAAPVRQTWTGVAARYGVED